MDSLFGPPILVGRHGQVIFASRPDGSYPALRAFQSDVVPLEERAMAAVALRTLVDDGEIINAERFVHLEDDLHGLHCGCLRLGVSVCPECWVLLAWFRTPKLLWTPAERMLVRRIRAEFPLSSLNKGAA